MVLLANCKAQRVFPITGLKPPSHGGSVFAVDDGGPAHRPEGAAVLDEGFVVAADVLELDAAQQQVPAQVLRQNRRIALCGSHQIRSSVAVTR